MQLVDFFNPFWREGERGEEGGGIGESAPGSRQLRLPRSWLSGCSTPRLPRSFPGPAERAPRRRSAEMKVLGHKIELLTGTAGSARGRPGARPSPPATFRVGAGAPCAGRGLGRLGLKPEEGVRLPADSELVRCLFLCGARRRERTWGCALPGCAPAHEAGVSPAGAWARGVAPWSLRLAEH